MNTRSKIACLLLALTAFLAAASANAKTPSDPGTPLPIDPAFNGGQPLKLVGTDGKPLSDVIDVAVLPDGRIVVLSYSELDAFNADGTRDTTFGNGGIADIDMTRAWSRYNQSKDSAFASLKATPDGRIAVVGSVELQPVIALFDATGQTVKSFGRDGYAAVAHSASYSGPGDRSTRIAFDRGGRIVVATSAGDDAERAVLQVSRLSSTGKRRRGFGRHGIATVDHYSNIGFGPQIAGVAVDSQNRIYLNGVIASNAGCEDTCPHNYTDVAIPFLVRLTASGRADRSFSKDGVAEPELLVGAPVGMLVTANGQAYMAGASGDVVQFTRHGQQSAKFASQSRFPYPSDLDLNYGDQILHRNADGSILIAGMSSALSFGDPASVVLRTANSSGIISDPATRRNLSANWFTSRWDWDGPPYALDYDRNDDPVLLSRRRVGEKSDNVEVYLARFAR